MLLSLMTLTNKYKCVCVWLALRLCCRCACVHEFLCVLLTMWEERKPRGSRQKGPADAGLPKMWRTNNKACNLDGSKTNHITNSRNIYPAHRWGQISLFFCWRPREYCNTAMHATNCDCFAQVSLSYSRNWMKILDTRASHVTTFKSEPHKVLWRSVWGSDMTILKIIVIINNWIGFQNRCLT